jgi:hypothetical protein
MSIHWPHKWGGPYPTAKSPCLILNVNEAQVLPWFAFNLISHSRRFKIFLMTCLDSVCVVLGLYKGVSKSFWISSVAHQQMAAQGCAPSYSDLQSWYGSVPWYITALTSGVVILVFLWLHVCGSLQSHPGQKDGITSHTYDPETKGQSSQWKSPSSPQPKKASMSSSSTKTMLIVFFDIQHIVHCKLFYIWGSGGTAPPLLTSALNGGEWSGLCPCCFTSRETAPGTHWAVCWVGTRDSLDAAERSKIIPY